MDESTRKRYEVLGKDLYVDLDIHEVQPKDKYLKVEADLLMSMVQDGYDPLQLTLEERLTFAQYFDLRLLDNNIKDDNVQDRKDNSKVPLDQGAKEGDLTADAGHPQGGGEP